MAKRKVVKVAIIGCGGFGNFHLDNLLKMEDVKVVALYNRGIENLEKTGRKVPEARLYQDYKALFQKEKPDCAIISLTPDAHGEVEEICCRKNIAMFIEKPIELSAEKAVGIAENIRFSGIINSVGYHERYSEPISFVKEIIAKEPVGLVTASWFGSMPGVEWWRTKSMSGGQVVEQTTHICDMMRYLFGEPVNVFATGVKHDKFGGLPHDVEDHSSAIINFKNGVTVNLISGCYAKGCSKIGFEIFTPNFRIEYKWGEALRVTSGDRTEEIRISTDHHVPALKTFIEAVRSGERFEIRSDYDDALATLKLTLAINESMETGELVICK